MHPVRLHERWFSISTILIAYEQKQTYIQLTEGWRNVMRIKEHVPSQSGQDAKEQDQ